MGFISLQLSLCLLCLFVAPADGTYTNPIIDADYSDPDVIRVGDDFYLTASSFNCIPGLPILHSKDLVNWKIIGHALRRQPPEDVFARPQHGNGVWAGLDHVDAEVFSLAPETATKRGYAQFDWFRFALPEQSSQTRARVQ